MTAMLAASTLRARPRGIRLELPFRGFESFGGSDALTGHPAGALSLTLTVCGEVPAAGFAGLPSPIGLLRHFFGPPYAVHRSLLKLDLYDSRNW